jgi:hypothetical protein
VNGGNHLEGKPWRMKLADRGVKFPQFLDISLQDSIHAFCQEVDVSFNYRAQARPGMKGKRKNVPDGPWRDRTTKEPGLQQTTDDVRSRS